jgi:hypothetical protein
MKRLFLLLAVASIASAAEKIEALGHKWSVTYAKDWSVETLDGQPTLRLLVARPALNPRRPAQYVLADTPPYSKVTLEAEVRREPSGERNRHTSLILVYAWRDADHFNYAHISVDTAKQAVVHNGLFHVYGGDRVRMSPLEGPATLPEERWYPVKLVYDASTGTAEVFVDGKTSPAMKAVDLSLGAGRVGLGSFFDLGDFRNVRISGQP